MLYNTLDHFWSVSLLKTTSKHLCSQNSRERSANNLCKLYASEAPSTTNLRDWNAHKKVAWQCTASIFLTSLTIRYHVNHYWLQCYISFSRKSLGTSAETSLCATGRRHENLRLYRSGHLPKNLHVLNAAALYLSHKCCDLHQYRRNLACYQCDDFIFATQLLGSSRSCYSTVLWTVPHDMVWVLPLPQFMQMETRTKNAIQICQCLIK